MKKLLQSLFVVMLFAASAMAQQRTITGTVTGQEDGMPLPNVSVRVKGSASGTSAGSDGKYTISIPANAKELVFSFIGYTAQSRVIGAGNVINVSLVPENNGLSEVVVVGYGTQKKKDVTGSVGTIKGETLKNNVSSSFDRQLAGQVTGVQASVSSGILGQPAKIRIRGTNSISSSSDPLVVVDGVPFISGDQGTVTPYNPLGDINPEDVESYSVLKDGSATAIYGSRAANGVILITTKRGKSGKAKISYDAWFAEATPSKRFKLLNADQFIMIANEKLTNTGAAAQAFPTPNPAGGTYDTNWQDVVFRHGFQQNHALAISGATDQTNYYFSLGFADLKGTTVNNALRKYNFRAKVEQKAFDNRLVIGANATIAYSQNNGLNSGAASAALSGNIASAIRALPNVPEFNPDGSYNVDIPNNVLGQGGNKRRMDDGYPNIGYILANNIYKAQALNMNGVTFLRANIIDGLTATTQLGITYLNVEDYQYWNPTHGDGRSVNGYIIQYNTPTFTYNWQNTLNYSKTLGDHQIDAVIGQEMQASKNRYISASGTGLSNPFFAKNGNIISNTLNTPNITGSSVLHKFNSIFARASYSYKDKYLVSASIRRDNISDLPKDNQGVTLPGASLGWRISKEDFFQDGLGFINDLKIRGGYAKVGNVNIGDFPYAGTFAPVQYGDVSGIVYSRMGNQDLRFETSKKIDVGLDASLFQNRIQLTVDYFKNNIDNMILGTPIPASLGVPYNKYTSNVGAMNNKGWEFGVTSLNMKTTDFSWSTTLNVSFVKNKITALANDNADLLDTYNIARVGNSLGQFYGFQSAGVNPANGNPLWVKANGAIVQGDIKSGNYYLYNPSNGNDFSAGALVKEKLTANDKQILGQANPTWYGGLSNSFTYKRFDFAVMFTFSGGNKIYNYTRQEALNNQKFLNNGTEILNRWTTPGQITDVPKVSYAGDGVILQTGNLNSRFLENGNFLRAQNISFGYTFNPELLSKVKINSLRLYAQVQNAFIITKYSGLDPELAATAGATAAATAIAANRTPGVDYNTNPVPRTFTLGINLGF